LEDSRGSYRSPWRSALTGDSSVGHEELGEISLRGKEEPVGIVAVDV
jgi:hypothetical protein